MATQRYNVHPNDQMTNRDQAKALEAHRLSQARHARTQGGYLQSLDRSMNKDSWGNSPSFLQGSMSSGADPLIQMGIDDKATTALDTEMANRGSVGESEGASMSRTQDIYGMDDMNQKLARPALQVRREVYSDDMNQNLPTPDVSELDKIAVSNDEAKRKFLSSANRSDDPRTMWDDIKDGVSNIYEKGKGLLDGSTAHKEGAEAAYNWKDKEEITNPTLLAAARQKENELGQWGDMANYSPPSSDTESLAEQMSAGSETGHHPESMMPAPQSLLAGQVGTGDQHGGQVLDSLADSPEATESTALTGKEKAMLKLGQSLLSGGQDSPDQRVPLAGVKMGRVAFPNLLASSQRPVNPRYTNKGLG